jgi:hypothetical protein
VFGNGLEAGLLTISGNEMYRISYDHGFDEQDRIERIEYFCTEFEALKRARQLLKGGDHHGVALHDDEDNVLTGIRLHLKLGMQPVD